MNHFLSQMKAVRNFTTSFFKDHFNNIFPSMPWLPKWSYFVWNKLWSGERWLNIKKWYKKMWAKNTLLLQCFKQSSSQNYSNGQILNLASIMTYDSMLHYDNFLNISTLLWNIPGSMWSNNPTSTCLFHCWNTDHMSPEEHTLVGCGTDVQEDPKMRDLKDFVKHRMRSMNTEPVIYTINSWLSTSQASRILMQRVKI